MSSSSEDTISVPYASTVVFDAVPRVLAKLHWNVERIDRPLGRFKVKIGMSLWTWGQTMFIDVSKIDDKSTRVHIYSEASGQIFDWGKNRRDIDSFFHELKTTLRNEAPPFVSPRLLAQAKEIHEENQKKLLEHYRLKYPHNPNGVLESHIHRIMREGKTREESEQELARQLGLPWMESPPEPSAEPVTATVPDDPVKILKLRLAKGEITKDQYKELLKTVTST